jgi:hypothetical protein
MAANQRNGPWEPFGYRRTEEGLEAIPEQLEALKKAFYYLDSGCSYQTTKEWLIKKTGREISHIGLRKLWLNKNKKLQTKSN